MRIRISRIRCRERIFHSIEISVPVTIRWNDDSLRLTLASQRQEEDEVPDSNDEESNVAVIEEVTV